MTKKRLLSWILALAMCLSVVSVPAMAETSDPLGSEDPAVKKAEYSYDSGKGQGEVAYEAENIDPTKSGYLAAVYLSSDEGKTPGKSEYENVSAAQALEGTLTISNSYAKQINQATVTDGTIEGWYFGIIRAGKVVACAPLTMQEEPVELPVNISAVAAADSENPNASPIEGATITVTHEKDGEIKPDSKTGLYPLIVNKTYTIKATAEGYWPATDTLNVSAPEEQEVTTANFNISMIGKLAVAAQYKNDEKTVAEVTVTDPVEDKTYIMPAAEPLADDEVPDFCVDETEGWTEYTAAKQQLEVSSEYQYVYAAVTDGETSAVRFGLIEISDPAAHTITLGAAEHGSVAVKVKGNETTPIEGVISNVYTANQITVVAKANEGYELTALTITDQTLDAEALEKAADSGSGYTFKMPDKNVEISATFTAHDYNVTVKEGESSGDVKGGSVLSSKATANVGDTVTLTVSPALGYELDTLTVQDGNQKNLTVTETEGDYTFTMPASDVTVKPTFKATKYTITVLKSTNGVIYVDGSEDNPAAEIGDKVTLRVIPAPGYELDQLTVKNDNTQNTVPCDIEMLPMLRVSGIRYVFTMPASAVTVSATFKAKTYSVTVITDEYGTVSADKAAAAAGTTVKLTVTPDTGYKLDSLAVKQDQSPIEVANNAFTMPAGEVSVVAFFTPETYAIKVAGGIANGSIQADQSAAYGTTVTLTAAADEGYALSALNVTDARGKSVTLNGNNFTMPASDVTVSATFAATQNAVTITPASNGAVTADSLNVETGKSVKLTVTPDAGYELDELTVVDKNKNPVTVTNNAFTMPAGGVTVSATFKKIIYTVTANVPTSGEGSIEAQKTASVGDLVDVKVTPATGYEISALTVRDANGKDVTILGSVGEYTFEMPASNVFVTVGFKKTSYTVTVSPIYNGTVTASKTTAYYGDTVTLAVKPEEGYGLLSLYVTGESEIEVTNNTFTMPASNVTVSASFEARPYALFDNGDGTIQKLYVTEGGKLEGAPVTPSKGDAYEFFGWFTEADAGEQVMDLSEFTFSTSLFSPTTLYARYTAKLEVETKYSVNVQVTLDGETDSNATIDAGTVDLSNVTAGDMRLSIKSSNTKAVLTAVGATYVDAEGATNKLNLTRTDNADGSTTLAFTVPEKSNVVISAAYNPIKAAEPEGEATTYEGALPNATAAPTGEKADNTATYLDQIKASANELLNDAVSSDSVQEAIGNVEFTATDRDDKIEDDMANLTNAVNNAASAATEILAAKELAKLNEKTVWKNYYDALSDDDKASVDLQESADEESYLALRESVIAAEKAQIGLNAANKAAEAIRQIKDSIKPVVKPVVTMELGDVWLANEQPTAFSFEFNVAFQRSLASDMTEEQINKILSSSDLAGLDVSDLTSYIGGQNVGAPVKPDADTKIQVTVANLFGTGARPFAQHYRTLANNSHKWELYEGTLNADGTLSFMTNGASPFVVTADNPAHAYTVGETENTYFLTLQDAVDAVASNGTIYLTEKYDPADTATASKSFKIDASAYENEKDTVLIAENAVTAASGTLSSTDNGDQTYSYTYTAPRKNNGGGGGGGGAAANITVARTTNGSVKVSNTFASAGDKVTVTLTPNSGYEADTLAVKDKNGKEITATRNSNGTYTFTMPAASLFPVTVTGTFKTTVAPSKTGFVDVNDGSYYAAAVEWAVKHDPQITNGTDSTHFSPEVSCTRGQVVTFLWRAAGAPEPKTTTTAFTDLGTTSEYYYKAVLWAVENGITNGTSETTFSPNVTVTRGQVVTFLYRYEKATSVAGGTFTDVAADAYYAPSVNWAYVNGITNGTSDTTFSPDNDCTRAQIVTFLYRDMVK